MPRAKNRDAFMSISTEQLIEDGYKTWKHADPFEDMIGPFYFKKFDDGTKQAAFVAEERHLNGAGMLHGGLLMSFADFALFVISQDHVEAMAVTVGFNSEFISAGPAGSLVEARGEVTKATGSLVFVRGEIFSGDNTIMTFSGIIKKIRAR
jgi:uncharacterized protein (TIGR00369 family)